MDNETGTCMNVAVMQPYIFPYLGYFNLIEASDLFVFYDDVNFVKKGWIHRNRILLNGNDFLFTIPLDNASQNKLISDIDTKFDDRWRQKFFKNIRFAYQKAPFYEPVSELIHSVFVQNDKIALLNIKSIQAVYDYLGCSFNYYLSSEQFADTKGMDRAERLINITKQAGGQKYTNLAGGQILYDKSYFAQKGIELQFLESILPAYPQGKQKDFIKGLSIIDILMYNDIDSVKSMFKAYRIF